MQCKKIFIAVFLFLLLVFASRPTTKASTGTITLDNGCSIILQDPAGLRYSATVSGDFSNEAVYGFALLRGEISRAKMIARYEAGTAAVVNVAPTDGRLAVSIINLSEADYVQDFTAIAFVNDGGVKTYSDIVVTRNIYEVAQAASIGGESNDFINNIIDSCHSVTYHYNGPLIHYASLSAMESDFIADFNSVTGKSIASASQFYGSAGTGFKDFFNDPTMNAKWVWLVDELESLRQQGYGNHDLCTTAYAHAKAMAMTDDLGDNIAFRQNIQGYFTKTRVATYSGYMAIDFSQLNVQLKMFETMNETKVEKNNTDISIVPTRNGYTFDGWFSDSACTVPVSNNGTSVSDVYAKWHMTNFTVTYKDGDSTLDLSPSSYYINTPTFSLPDYAKGGYSFDGWYDNSELTGSPVTEVEAGSFGNKTFYAKTTQTANVGINVTLDADGGLIPSSWISDSSVRTIALETYSNTGNATPIYLCSTAVVPNNGLKWQYKILLKYHSDINAYEVVATDGAKATANDVASAAGVTWTHAIASPSASSLHTYATVGQYIVLSVNDLVINMDPFSAYVYNASSMAGDTHVLTLETELPTPAKEGYTFLGWRNSRTSLLETTFPGYTTPGDITYTAEWEAN